MLEADLDLRSVLGRAGVGRSASRLSKHQVIYSQGDAADCMYFLLEGRIKVLVLSGSGKEVAAGMIEPGEFFGDGCLIGEECRNATTIAMQDCVVVPIAKEALLSALREQPEFAELLIRHLLLRNRRIEEDLVDQLMNSSEKRLARLLLRLAADGDDGAHKLIATPISQETLAEMIGTTRSRVSYFMNKFRRLGLISYDRNIEIDPVRLSAALELEGRGTSARRRSDDAGKHAALRGERPGR